MERAKKIATIVVLLVIAVAAVVYGVSKLRGEHRKPPNWLMAQPKDRIDDKTLETITLTRQEWENLGKQGNRYKNPYTGEYTVAERIACLTCGRLIPCPPDMSSHEAVLSYKCPICGGQASD